MRRMIVVTFGCLGLAFYLLSGGTTYAPAEGSFQATGGARPSPQARPPALQAKPPAPPPAPPETSPPNTAGADLRVPLPGTATEAPEIPMALPVQDDPDLRPFRAGAVALLQRQEIRNAQIVASRAPAPPADIRHVSATSGNMRSGPGTEFPRITRLNAGDEVRVLHDDGAGWVHLVVVETGDEGWMADWLISAAD